MEVFSPVRDASQARNPYLISRRTTVFSFVLIPNLQVSPRHCVCLVATGLLSSPNKRTAGATVYQPAYPAHIRKYRKSEELEEHLTVYYLQSNYDVGFVLMFWMLEQVPKRG